MYCSANVPFSVFNPPLRSFPVLGMWFIIWGRFLLTVSQSLKNLLFQVFHLGSIYSALFHLLFSISEEKRLLIPSTFEFSTLLRWKPLGWSAKQLKRLLHFWFYFAQIHFVQRKPNTGFATGRESRTEEQQLETAEGKGHLKSMVLSPMSVSASSPASSPSMIAPSS